jgi:hypothetical protein
MQFLLILFVALFLGGCQSKQQPSSEPQKNDKTASTQSTAPAKPADVLTGKVLERLDAGRYSYLRLSTSTGEIWAAVPQSGVKVGEEVSMANPMPMEGFETKTLNRKFDRIYFGTLQQPEGAETAQALQSAHSGVAEPVSAGPIKVEKAAGPEGQTVGDVFSQKLKLKDRNVAVRGKVIKVNANIMGKNWIHIQDGTGDPKIKTNDLTVTSQSSASLGDTVLVKGVVRLDKNLGMGYLFPVIIEDATVTKQ